VQYPEGVTHMVQVLAAATPAMLIKKTIKNNPAACSFLMDNFPFFILPSAINFAFLFNILNITQVSTSS
jgi:hypothetical protein